MDPVQGQQHQSHTWIRRLQNHLESGTPPSQAGFSAGKEWIQSGQAGKGAQIPLKSGWISSFCGSEGFGLGLVG